MCYFSVWNDIGLKVSKINPSKLALCSLYVFKDIGEKSSEVIQWIKLFSWYQFTKCVLSNSFDLFVRELNHFEKRPTWAKNRCTIQNMSKKRDKSVKNWWNSTADIKDWRLLWVNLFAFTHTWHLLVNMIVFRLSWSSHNAIFTTLFIQLFKNSKTLDQFTLKAPNPNQIKTKNRMEIINEIQVTLQKKTRKKMIETPKIRGLFW